MTLPLIFLAAVTLVAGFIPFGKFVSSNGVEYVSHLDGSVAGVSILIACVAIAVATWFYAKGSSALPGKIAEGLGGFYKAAVHRFYIDEVYLFITRRLIFSGRIPNATRCVNVASKSMVPSTTCLSNQAMPLEIPEKIRRLVINRYTSSI